MMPPNRPGEPRTGAETVKGPFRDLRAVLGQPEPTKDELEREGRALLAKIGWITKTTSQGYRKGKGGTRVSPGLPDIYAFHPAKRLTLWWEAKPAFEVVRLEKLRLRTGPIPPSLQSDWKRARAQYAFGELCRQVEQPYCYGPIPALLACLNTLGFKIG